MPAATTSPATFPQLARKAGPVGICLCVLFCAVLLYLRRPGALSHPQMWAEDSIVFFNQAEVLGLGSLVHPHVGYLHTVPRLVAWAARAFDPGFAAAIYCYSAFLLGLASCALIASASIGESRILPLLMPLAVICAPHFSGEVYSNLTNVQWLLAPCLLLPLIARPVDRIGPACVMAGIQFIIATTTPFSIALLPLFVLRLLERRTPAVSVALFGAMLGAACQIAAVLSASGTGVVSGGASLRYHLELFGSRVVAQTFGFGPAVPASPAVRLAIGIAGVASLVALAAWSRSERKTIVWICAGLLGLFLAVALRIRTEDREAALTSISGDRYYYCIRVLLLWVVMMAMIPRRRMIRIAAGILLALALSTSIRSFCVAPWIDYHWERYGKSLKAGVPVDIPVNPTWTYHYPGREARRG